MTQDPSSIGQALADLLARGGPVVAILLALSVVALAIVLLKLTQFARSRIWHRAWLPPVLAAVAEGERERALELAAKSPNPIARVIEVALLARDRLRGGDAAAREAMRDEVQRAGLAELAHLESNLRGLETIGNLAPLLGLLGTVLGMIRAFMRVEEAGGNADPALLAGGIWEALLTTAVALSVAIPVLAALSWLESQVDRLRRRLSDAVTRVLTMSDGGREREDRRAL